MPGCWCTSRSRSCCGGSEPVGGRATPVVSPAVVRATASDHRPPHAGRARRGHPGEDRKVRARVRRHVWSLLRMRPGGFPWLVGAGKRLCRRGTSSEGSGLVRDRLPPTGEAGDRRSLGEAGPTAPVKLKTGATGLKPTVATHSRHGAGSTKSVPLLPFRLRLCPSPAPRRSAGPRPDHKPAAPQRGCAGTPLAVRTRACIESRSVSPDPSSWIG